MLLDVMSSEPFMYGIATPDGTAHFGEYCVCESPAYLEDEVDCLNSDRTEEGAPLYHVVALFRHPAQVAVPDAIPRSVYDVIYQECGGFVDCDANPQTIWKACRAAMLQPGTLTNEGTKPVSQRYTLPPHIYRELVNQLRETAVKYQGCQQLREQISETLSTVITPAAHEQQNSQQNIPEYIPGWGRCSKWVYLKDEDEH